MTEVTIGISGAGMTFHYETYLVEKVLKEAGFDVQLIDDHPIKEEHKTDFIINAESGMFSEKTKKRKIIIKTHHLPWGG